MHFIDCVRRLYIRSKGKRLCMHRKERALIGEIGMILEAKWSFSHLTDENDIRTYIYIYM